MAFNPFDVFRRNQRILFAVLTVFVMFMFVLSSGLGGGGDFFDWLPQWLGSQSRHGETVATFDGGRVTTSQIGDVAQQRRLANRYMILAMDRTRANLAKYVADNQQRVSKANEPTVQGALQAHSTLQMFGGQQLGQEIMGMILQQISSPLNNLEQMLAKKDLPDDDREVAAAARALLETDLRLTFGGTDPQYFINAPNATDRDRLNFLLWEKKAEQLGINLTVADMEDLLDAEFLRQLTDEDRLALSEAFLSEPNFKADDLRQALIEEFEVRIAQQVVMGSEFVRNQSQPTGTPYGFYEYYREKSAEALFGMIRVPVANYLDKVEGEPKESELRKLFANHRSNVPNPASPEPGFREPRKLKLTWLEVEGNEPYYTKEAKTTLEMIPTVFGLSVLGQALNPLNAVTAAVVADNPDMLLDAEARTYRDEYNKQLDERWFNPNFGSSVTDGTVNQAATIGSIAGIFSGNLVSGGPALAGIGAVYDSVNTIERHDRLRTLPSIFAVPIMGGPATFDSVLLPVVAQAAATPAPSFAGSKSELTQRVTTQMARTLALNDLQKFQTELAKRGASVDPDAAKRYAEEFIKARGLKSGQSTQPRDMFSIGDDPGLEPMAKLAAQPHGGQNFRIGQQFFYQQDPQTRRIEPTVGLYQPEPYPAPQLAEPTPEQPVMLVWRSDEIKQGTAPKSLNDPGVKEKVVAAWRMEQARELAKKDAEELAKQWQEIVKTEKLQQNSPSIGSKMLELKTKFMQTFNTEPKQEAVEYFAYEVAPIKIDKQDIFTPTPPQIVEFQLGPSSNIPYPTLAMQQSLLEQQKEPLGNAEVMVDNAKANYYVSVLERNIKKSSGEFSLSVYRSLNPMYANVQNVFRRGYQDELRAEARERAIELLKAEFGYAKENATLLDSTSDE